MNYEIRHLGVALVYKSARFTPSDFAKQYLISLNSLGGNPILLTARVGVYILLADV